MPDRVTLRVGGRRYGGWTALRIQRSIEAVAGSFEVELTERHPSRPSARLLRPGAEVAVEIGSDPVITGYIDDVAGEADEDGITVRIAGRDRTGDLVDCAPDLDPSEWRGITLGDLARRIAAPFGVEVLSEIEDAESISRVVLNPGQGAWALLEERARYRSTLLVSDGLGNLVLTRAGQGGRADSLREGANLRGAAWSYSQRERFSEYVVRGQHGGTDWLSGATIAGPEGRASDAGVSRHRPFVQVVSSSIDVARAQARAAWEATVRAGRAQRAEAVVAGWRQRSGALWAPNALARIDSEAAGIAADLLIAAVEYTLDPDSADGTTRLSLVPPEAYAVAPPGAIETTEIGF